MGSRESGKCTESVSPQTGVGCPPPSLKLVQGNGYKGEGRSSGLCRGFLLISKGENITREGMGIGCPVLVSGREPIFSRTCRCEQNNEAGLEHTFSLDTGLHWGIAGRPSQALTRLMNGTVDLYMHHASVQYLLPIGSAIRSLLCFQPIWYDTGSKAEARVIAQEKNGSATITCHLSVREGSLPTIFLLNELGGDAFSVARSKNGTEPPPTGWEPYEPSAGRWLHDPKRNIHFCIAMEAISEGVITELFWGREHTRDLCWAGYGFRITPLKSLSEVWCRYAVMFHQGEGP